MALEQQVMAELVLAMKSKNEAAIRSLRAIKAAIINAKTAEGAHGELKAEDEIKLLQKLVKQRKDSLEIYDNQKRDDLAVKEREEITVIEKFLPTQMNAAELRTAVAGVIEDLGANSPADMGKVMGAATKKLAGLADGKAIGAIVKELLSK